MSSSCLTSLSFSTADSFDSIQQRSFAHQMETIFFPLCRRCQYYAL
jgi:hypothetical protein